MKYLKTYPIFENTVNSKIFIASIDYEELIPVDDFIEYFFDKNNTKYNNLSFCIANKPEKNTYEIVQGESLSNIKYSIFTNGKYAEGCLYISLGKNIKGMYVDGGSEMYLAYPIIKIWNLKDENIQIIGNNIMKVIDENYYISFLEKFIGDGNYVILNNIMSKLPDKLAKKYEWWFSAEEFDII